MRASKLSKLSDDTLLKRREQYKFAFLGFTIITVLIFLLGNVPAILGELYPEASYFRYAFTIFFVLAYMSYSNWRTAIKVAKKKALP